MIIYLKGECVMVYLMELNNGNILLDDYTIEMYESIIMPIYKGKERVETIKLDVTLNDDDEIEFVEMLSKKAEIGDYKRVKYLNKKEMTSYKSMYNCLVKECKNRAKMHNSPSLNKEDRMYSRVFSYIMYDEDDDNSSKSYLSMHEITKGESEPMALNFAVLVSEDTFVIKELLKSAVHITPLNNVVLDSEDSFSVMKAVGVDLFMGQENTEEREQS